MGGSKVTSKICSRFMLWRINNLVQCNKMESKSHSAQCKQNFSNEKQLSIKHTSIVNIIRFATERLKKNCSKQKLRKPKIIINIAKCDRHVARNLQLGDVLGFENFAFFSKIA